MTDAELLIIVIGVAVVVLATVSAWLESRSEARGRTVHRKVLWRTHAYRDHLARRKGRGGQ